MSKNISNISIWTGSIILCLLGIVMLVAGKTGAGAALLGLALVIVLPLGRYIKNRRWVIWLRVVVGIILALVAYINVMGTDIKSEQRVTGIDIIDKSRAIFLKFGRIVTGTNTEENTAQPGQITQEKANEMAGCMRAQGLTNLPDPTITEDGLSFDFAAINATQEQIKAAQSACQHILKSQ